MGMIVLMMMTKMVKMKMMIATTDMIVNENDDVNSVIDLLIGPK